MRLQVAQDVRIWPVKERGEWVYRVELPRSHQFFRVGYREYYLLSLLDGETSLPQACSLATAKLGRDAPTADETNAIAGWLLENQIIHDIDEPTPTREPRATSTMATILGRFNPFWMKLTLPNAERWITPVAAYCSPLLATPAVMTSLVCSVIAVVMFFTQRAEFLSGGTVWFHPSRWVWMGVIFVGLKLVHEMSHAIACHRQGCQVSQAGVVMVLLAPLAFVDVTSCWRLQSRWARFLVSAAGMFVELTIASIAMVTWTLNDDPWCRSVCQGIVMTAGLSTLIFNANVLMRFDGYHILADWVDIPNLATESQRCVHRWFRRWFLGDRDTTGSRFVGWRRWMVACYGIAAAMWKWMVCLSLAIAASAMFQGAGVLIAALGVIMWLGLPALETCRMMFRLRSRKPVQFYRGTVLGVAFAATLFGAVFYGPLPTTICVPAITQYAASTLVRVRVSGFVDQIYVRQGQLVDQGEPLLMLRNDELQQEMRSLELDRKIIDLDRRKASKEQNETESRILKRRLSVIDQRLTQLRQRQDSLLVRSPQTGLVAARDLNQLRDTYLKEGDAIMNVARGADVEWIALIPPQHVHDIRSLIGQPIQVRTPAREWITTNLEMVEPSASDLLGYPSLAAIHGGSLITKTENTESGDDRMRLAQPHFQARLQVPEIAARGVRVGMRLEAFAGSDTTPVAARMRNYFRNLWRDQQRLR